MVEFLKDYQYTCKFASQYSEFSAFAKDCEARRTHQVDFIACKACSTGVAVGSGALTHIPGTKESIITAQEIAADIQEILANSTLVQGDATDRWVHLPREIIPNILSLSHLQIFWRRPIIYPKSSGICPNCLRFRAYRGYGLCSSCVEAVGDLSGKDLLHELILTSTMITEEIDEEEYKAEDDVRPGIIETSSQNNSRLHDIHPDVYESLTLRTIRPFWKAPLITTSSICPNCDSSHRSTPNGICSVCAIHASKKTGQDLLDALKTRQP